MTKRTIDPTGTNGLRERAVERLAGRLKRTSAPPESAARLLQELEIHRVELEMQNEQLRATRDELEAGLDRYTQLFDFAPIGYATLSVDGIVREVNHVGANILGEPRARIVGRSFAVFVSPPEHSEFGALLRVVANDRSRRVHDFAVIRSTEDKPRVRFVVNTLAGKDATILLAFEDVTHQRHAEARLRQIDDELREADRRKDEFLAVLSHELRTPLSSLLMHGQLLQHGDMTTNQVHRAGEVVERAAKAQARLIDDLLDVSRIISGKLRMKEDDVNLAAAVHAAVEAVANDARKKKIALEVSIDPTTPTTLGDSPRLQQAILNVLINAIKFTPEGGRIQVTLDEIDRQARIEVRDNGAGIEAAFLPHLFVRFSQADRTTTRSAGGLGLGLSIAHSIIEAHRGTIQARSAGRGLGSTFTIMLPVTRDRPALPKALPTAKAPSEANLKGARLLVVEDDPSTRSTLTRVLERAGAKVRDADSGEAALKVLGRFKPDLIVCDIAMPKEDGCSLLRRIRARGKKRGGELRALALTAFASEEDRARTLAAGFQEHLVKPVDVDRLLATVSGLLPRKEGSGRQSTTTNGSSEV